MKTREERRQELEQLPKQLVAEIYIHANAQKTGHLKWPSMGMQVQEVIEIILAWEYPDESGADENVTPDQSG